ncbi:MAG: DUF4282 domain-containing protein [Bacillota bacterium]
MNFNDYFKFKNMVSVSIIKILYLLGFIVITVGGFSYASRDPAAGLFMLIMGNLIWRVICEGAVILFSIHERLAAVERLQEKEIELRQREMVDKQ